VRGRSEAEELVGTVRIAAFSSVLRSVVLPSVAALVRRNPGLSLHVSCHEVDELPRLLVRGEATFVVTDREVHRGSVERALLGAEQ
jgi:DNA-binding transcriptional LysR family regulator